MYKAKGKEGHRATPETFVTAHVLTLQPLQVQVCWWQYDWMQHAVITNESDQLHYLSWQVSRCTVLWSSYKTDQVQITIQNPLSWAFQSLRHSGDPCPYGTAVSRNHYLGCTAAYVLSMVGCPWVATQGNSICMIALLKLEGGLAGEVDVVDSCSGAHPFTAMDMVIVEA